MSHTYSQNYVHVVFSTKDRRDLIAPEFQPQLWAYIAGICRKHGLEALAIGGAGNHVHALVGVPPTVPLAKAVMFLKANSSRWMAERAKPFAWQQGYGAFSVSASNVDAVTRYIQNQPIRYRKVSFEDEFRSMLRKHGVEYDPTFVLG